MNLYIKILLLYIVLLLDMYNASLKNDEIGKEAEEAVSLFDRKQITIKSSDVAATTAINAFEQDMTLMRAIERLDVVARDTAALVNGYIDI